MNVAFATRDLLGLKSNRSTTRGKLGVKLAVNWEGEYGSDNAAETQ